jgi:hypothetical protein
MHMTKPGKVTIAGHPSDELPPKTLASLDGDPIPEPSYIELVEVA